MDTDGKEAQVITHQDVAEAIEARLSYMRYLRDEHQRYCPQCSHLHIFTAEIDDLIAIQAEWNATGMVAR